MSERVLPLTCQIPANTPISAPATFPLVFAPSKVERIEVRVPPGPNGLMGFSINNGGGNYIPEGSGNWIIDNDRPLVWDVTNAPDNGNWLVVAYNLDVLVHTIYVRFSISGIPVVNLPSSSGMLGL